MEEERTRLVVALPPDDDDGASAHGSKVLSKSTNPTFDLKALPSFVDARTLLLDGTVDLMVVSARQWEAMDRAGLMVASVFPRREPTWVLVAEDKPEMLQHGARIGCDHPLLKRQLLRLRQDVILVDPSEGDPSWPEQSAAVRIEAWEAKRVEGDLDGYVVPRAMHASIEGRAPRRHTLGLHREDHARQRFIPPALGGFTLLVARSGFPVAPLKKFSEAGAVIAHRLERAMEEAIPEALRPITGIHVERRRIGTIIQEAAGVEDEHAIEALLDPESDLRTKGHRLEILMETVAHDGRGTAASERVFPEIEAHSGMVRALEEWAEVLEAMTTDHEDLGRGVHWLGEFEDAFVAAHDAMMRLEEQ